MTDFVDWNVGKGQHRNNVLSSRLLERIYGSFFDKMSQIDTENDTKTRKFPIFKDFMHFLKVMNNVRRLEYFIGSTRKTLVVQKSFVKR